MPWVPRRGGGAWGRYLDGGRPLLLLLLQGVELLLPQELRPGVHGELAWVLHVGGGAPAPIHGGPQGGLVHDVSCGEGQRSHQTQRRRDAACAPDT